ncbi:hypothetical protein LJC31_04720 [Synergistaceae bacterium OttesenSCG-928-I11]|nr:hypothetical protein [Synergistaceae bacterium OttesenSCG-928-I11]
MYFSEKGKSNTRQTIDLAVKTAKERNIGQIVVASNTGETAEKLLDCGVNVVCVTHAYGYKEKGENEMPREMRAKLIEKGMDVYTSSHVLSGVERGISNHAKGMYPAEIMSYTLRMFGQGVKVCVEISTMALDAGLIPYGEKIVAIAGTQRGADTAVILTPAHANEIFRTYFHEILCKPA